MVMRIVKMARVVMMGRRRSRRRKPRTGLSHRCLGLWLRKGSQAFSWQRERKCKRAPYPECQGF
jgi:hypothetical protein